MDTAKFDEWLGAMAALTVPQRREAWQRLALCEASDSASGAHEMPSGSATPDVGTAAADDLPVAPSPLIERPSVRVGADLVAELGQRRLASIGCPIASAVRSGTGGGRAGSRATAARTAVARSMR
jgi:hypothetical protein